MPRFKLKAFDPHNPDSAARTRWDKLQRGETKHKYDLPPTQPGKRTKRTKQQPNKQQKQKQPAAPSAQQQQADNERLSLNQRRFQTQILAARGEAPRRPKSAPDTEARDKRTIRKDKKGKRAVEEEKDDGERGQAGSNKKRRTQTAEEAEAEEQHTRRQWEDKVATIKGKHSSSSSSTTPQSQSSLSPPPPPPREFAGVERIPFGFQVERPPQHLTQLKNKRAAAGDSVAKGGGKLSMEQYAAERQKAQEAYAEMRKKRREAEKT